MKLFIVIILLFFQSCSFDDKSGIWKNQNSNIQKKDDNLFKDFRKITSSTKIYDEVIPLDKNLQLNIKKPISNKSWTDYFYNQYNNTTNFNYTNLGKTVFKSKKLSRYKMNEFILVENRNIISNDIRGNIIIYSIDTESIIGKFNFYKKRYKKIKKNINLKVEENIIYATDNIGFVYAYNYIEQKILWAKNYKKPFRSNIKILSDKLIVSNQNNDLLILNKYSGDLEKLIPSEETVIKNFFINNISLSKDEILFLNTFGSLYSIDKNNLSLNWFINLNKRLNLNYGNLFSGSQIVNSENKILISSNENFYIIDSKNGTILNRKNFALLSRPIIINNYVFLITKNNFLILMNLKNGAIIYSYDITQKLVDFLDSKKNKIQVKSFLIINNEIYIFLKNSHLVKFKINGEIKEVSKLSSAPRTYPMVIEDYLIYLNNKNNLIIVN